MHPPGWFIKTETSTGSTPWTMIDCAKLFELVATGA
jgi:hypothetical protein